LGRTLRVLALTEHPWSVAWFGFINAESLMRNMLTVPFHFFFVMLVAA
jgi:hypothetical protein